MALRSLLFHVQTSVPSRTTSVSLNVPSSARRERVGPSDHTRTVVEPASSVARSASPPAACCGSLRQAEVGGLHDRAAERAGLRLRQAGEQARRRSPGAGSGFAFAACGTTSAPPATTTATPAGRAQRREGERSGERMRTSCAVPAVTTLRAPGGVRLAGERAAREGVDVRVLVVDDEVRMAEAVARGLRAEGFAVDLAHDGVDGLHRATTEAYDAIVLDVMLPGLSGYRVVERLRAAGAWTPVLMLSAKDGEYDQADALDLGADDYLTKPFSYVVLLARLRALVRRGAQERPVRLTAGDLVLDPGTKQVHRGDVEISLTAREFALLEPADAQQGLRGGEGRHPRQRLGQRGRQHAEPRRGVRRVPAAQDRRTVRSAGGADRARLRLRARPGRRVSVPAWGVRTRLTVLATAVTAAALVVAAVLLVLGFRAALLRSLDDSARQRGQEVSALVDAGRLPDPLPVTGAAVVQVLDEDGRVASSSPGGDRLSPLLDPDGVRAVRGGAAVEPAGRAGRLDRRLPRARRARRPGRRADRARRGVARRGAAGHGARAHRGARRGAGAAAGDRAAGAPGVGVGAAAGRAPAPRSRAGGGRVGPAAGAAGARGGRRGGRPRAHAERDARPARGVEPRGSAPSWPTPPTSLRSPLASLRAQPGGGAAGAR
nr:response regulator transcription factor [Angustibacter aerolatus]